MSTYSVVLFVKQEEVCVVSTSWIFQTGGDMFCWWPGFHKDEDNDKAVVKHKPPVNSGDGEWKVHTIKILGKPYDSLITARQKRNLAEQTSDINTDVDEKGRPTRRVRRRLEDHRHSVSSDDAGTAIPTDTVLDAFPLPPDVPTTQMPAINQRLTPSLIKPKKRTTTPKYFAQTVLSGYGRSTNDASEDVSSTSSSRPYENGAMPSRPQVPITSTPTSHSDDESEQNESNLQFRKQVMRSLTCMKVIQQQHGEMLDLILRHLEKNGDENVNANGNAAIMDIPVQTQDELEQLEEKVQSDAAFKSQLITQISRCGGTCVQDAVKRMMGRLLSNSVAAEFSWLGFKKKKRFDQLLLKDVLFDAVRRNLLTKQASEQEIEIAVKKWLQHAKQRAQK